MMWITKRYGMFYSIVVYSFLSILTVHVTRALQLETSAFDLPLFYELARSSVYIFLMFGLFIASATFYFKFSLILYYFASLAVVVFLLVSLYEDFSKAILFIVFFYSALSYFLGQGWRQTLHFACYNPRLPLHSLNDVTAIKIEVQVVTREGTVHEGYLTNWDEVSCFVKFSERVKGKLSGSIRVIAEYRGRKFENGGQLVSSLSGGRGVGIIFDLDDEKRFNWQNFYNILDQISFTPDYLIN